MRITGFIYDTEDMADGQELFDELILYAVEFNHHDSSGTWTNINHFVVAAWSPDNAIERVCRQFEVPRDCYKIVCIPIGKPFVQKARVIAACYTW